MASARGSLLLGQSFLGRFKSWSIDNAKHVLVLEVSGAPPAPASVALPPRRTSNGESPCAYFQKLADGTWYVIKQIKIHHGNVDTILNPGIAVGPGSHVAGADVYGELQRNCQ